MFAARLTVPKEMPALSSINDRLALTEDHILRSVFSIYQIDFDKYNAVKQVNFVGTFANFMGT